MFLVRKVRRGRGVTVLSWDKTEVSCGVHGRRWWMQEDGSQILLRFVRRHYRPTEDI